ncbi:MAG: VTT domain-containing protein [Chloroflexi bacterium]|nr:VTT domain-containing protein [Chloroflexota bacterium]
MTENEPRKINWLKLGIIFLIFAVFSVALAYATQILLQNIHLPLYKYELAAYLTIFVVAIVVNLSLVPLPFVVSIMIVAASRWNPWLVALSGSLGASLGEMSYYYLGFISKKVAVPDDIIGYAKVKGWVEKYGMWAIAFLSFQPVLPIEIGGLVAGLTRYPLYKFLIALWIGKFPKYIILIFLGSAVLHIFPMPHLNWLPF